MPKSNGEYSEYSIKKIIKNIVNTNGICGTITASANVSINHDNSWLIIKKVDCKKEKENA